MMGRWDPPRAARASFAVAITLLLAACSSSTAAPSEDLQSSTNLPAVENFHKLVDVGDGRTVSVTCWGDASTIVVYLHGLIMPSDTAKWAHAPELRERLAPEATYCEYERANVGASSSQPGPIPIDATLADLDSVLDAIGASSPVILVGGSFGGLVATVFAGTRSDRVAGVVLLDPSLPGSNAAEEQYLPPDYRLTPDAWMDSAEKIDVYAADPVAVAALATIPSIPGTVFVTEQMELPPVNTDAFLAAIRAQQHDLAARFAPGEIITVDAPHAMVSVVPDEIADAVRDVIAASTLGTG